MKILVASFLSLFLIFSIASADETCHRFHGKDVHRTYSYNYDYDYDYDFDYDFDKDFDFDFDFDKDFNIDLDDDHKFHGWNIGYDRSHFLNNIDLDFDDGSIILTNDRHDDEVEITENHDLIINGDEVELDATQRRLVGEFYDQTYQLIDQAKLVGKEGAKIGVKGAKLGVSTIFKLFHLLSPNYDTDDMEREVEAQAELLEAEAKDLESYARDIEDMADDIEDIAEQMSEDIPEIDRLGWF